MTTLIRKLALAAAVTALAPGAARACESPRPAARVAVTAPAVIWKVDARWGDGDHRDGDWRDGDHRDGDWRDGDHREGDWRDGDRRGEGWRDGDHDRSRRSEPGRWAWVSRERVQLRADYARLDETRARFYSFPHRPWRVRQFEAWYAHEHAELDARWARVS